MSAVDEIEIVSFSSGDYLFHENERTFHFFIIQEGQVEVFKAAKNGAKIPLALCGPGVSLGEFAALDRQPRSATARAVTDVRVARISEAAYRQLLQELPDWAISVMQALVERVRATNEVVRKAGFVNEEVMGQIEALQLDSSNSITETAPDLLGPATEDDESTLVLPGKKD